VSPSHTPPRITIDLPFEARGAGLGGSGGEADTTTTTSLGLDGVGRTPSFTPSERRALDSQRYTPADLRAAWDWLGPEVKERGACSLSLSLSLMLSFGQRLGLLCPWRQPSVSPRRRVREREQTYGRSVSILLATRVCIVLHSCLRYDTIRCGAVLCFALLLAPAVTSG
jgi:hypothetical protein